MVGRFPWCKTANMAAVASADDLAVINNIGSQYRPFAGHMTSLTHVGGLYMIGGFGHCGAAIMTRIAGAEYFGVINKLCWHPSRRIMTSFTALRGINVIRTFGESDRAVMALATST